MAWCQICKKEFKSQQGLSGHQQLKHAGEGSAQRQCEGSFGAQTSAGEVLASGNVGAGVALGQRSDEQLERIESTLEGLVGRADSERHQRDHEVAQLAFDKGYERAMADMIKIPGVELAKAYNDEANARNEKYPDQSPMVDSFGDMPGVWEAMNQYRIGMAIIEIYRD